MKNWIVFTIVFCSSFFKTLACGYSPYGEDVRYSFFKPNYFNFKGYSSFEYNANSFGFQYEYMQSSDYDSNVYDWYAYTGKKVPITAIYECLNTLSFSDIYPSSSNAFVQFLFQKKQKAVLEYMLIAKKCESMYLTEVEDPWERNTVLTPISQEKFLTALIQKTKRCTSLYLQRKYAFLTIRYAYYIGKYDQLHTTFQSHFLNTKKDYLYYWSLYFDCFTRSDYAKDIAEILANCPEKRYPAYFYFHDEFQIKKGLQQSKSLSEIANVYAYASMQKLDYNGEYLRKIYANAPHAEVLSFLLVREINKLEDWIYTPYYSNYLPSVVSNTSYFNDEVYTSTELLRNRSQHDRIKAIDLLEFVSQVDLSKVNKPHLWVAARVQLLFMAQNYQECAQSATLFLNAYPNEKVAEEVEKIRALALTANQQQGKAIIPSAVYPTIQKNWSDTHFIFALGRELEYLGNLSDGLALIATANKNAGFDYEYNSTLEWQGNRNAKSGNLIYFYSYFDYIDFVYTADQMKQVVKGVQKKQSSPFLKHLYAELLKDKPILIDLWGTKYIRENRLEAALHVFSSLGEKYWNDYYNDWERNDFAYTYTLQENPFYKIKFTEQFIKPKEKLFKVNKLTVVKNLIRFQKFALNPNHKDRDYYCFLVANCYLSMAEGGNSWMMRRFNYSHGNWYADDYQMGRDSYSDEVEFRKRKLAQHYYQMAYKAAKTKQFKALCIRMIDFAGNTDFKQLKKLYPEYYEELSTCDQLAYFFEARR